MAKLVALIGSELDKSHGGKITKGSTTTTWNGVGIARLGDEVVCSKHGKTTIVSGCSTICTVDGLPAAVVGAKCACGAVIEKSTSLLTVES